uniref:BTB domain-containing protein n=1 Tax=Panagrolaimus superbus TaxID=310955 RepID=A0A914YES9_9BILA
MASGEAVINHCTRNKMFSWTFNDLDKISREHYVVEKSNDQKPWLNLNEGFLMTSPIIATDSFNNTEYTAICQLGNSYTIKMEIHPIPGEITAFYELNDCESKPLAKKLGKFCFMTSTNEHVFKIRELLTFNGKAKTLKKLHIFLNVSTICTKVYQRSPFYHSNKFSLIDELKEMWKNDEKIQFIIIKCETEEFKVSKPIMIARSPVFKKMFETEMKEKLGNFVEIKGFNPKIVKKMIEFCENFAVEKMAENIKNEKIADYIQLANLYDLHEFKEWCMQYAQRQNFVL